MRRFFARNLLFVVGINLLVKPVWVFVIDRNVQNLVGHAPFGLYQALLNLAVIFQIILDFGLNSYNTRTISVSPEKFSTQFPQLLTARLLLIGVYASVVMGVGYISGYRGSAILLLGGVILLQALSILLMFVRSNVAALQHFKMDGVLSVIDRFLMIFICGALLFIPSAAKHFRIEWFVGTQIGCYAIAVVAGIFMLRRIAHMPQLISFQLKPVLGILKQGFPYALLAFLMSIYMRSDVILLERLGGSAGAEQGGIYTSAFRMLDVTNMISIMVAAVLMPLFGRMLAEKQPVAPIIRLCANLLLPASFFLMVTGWTMGEDIMRLLYHTANAYNGRLFALLMTAAPAYSIMYIYSTLLTSNGHIGLLNKLAGAGAVISVSLNLILIPRHMAMGAAVTAGITQWLLAAGYIYFAVKKNGLPTHKKWILSHIAFVVLLSLTGYSLGHFALPWLQKLMVLIITAVVLVLAFGFISFRSVRALLSKGQPDVPA